MVRLVGLVVTLGACGFHIPGGSSAQDAGGDGSVITDGDVADMAIDEMPPPIDGDRSDWWNPQWTHRRRLTLDTSTFTGPVTDFPVLVRLPALAGVSASGADLRFVSIDGTTTYAYDLDSFSALGSSAIWVKMTIPQASVDTELWVYYGNPAAQAATSGAMVFSPTHVSVHHLGSFVDATGNGHLASNGSVSSVPSTNLAGRIGAARTFDGTDDYLALANGDGPYDFTVTMSASAWVKVAGFEDEYQAIVTKGDSSWRLARANTTNGVAFGWNDSNNLLGTTSVTGTEWRHVAIVQTQTTKNVYVDGQLDETIANSDLLDNNSYSVRFGMNEESTSGGARYWHGDIDEVRISATSRDAAWISAEHRTTAPAFTTVGVDETY